MTTELPKPADRVNDLMMKVALFGHCASIGDAEEAQRIFEELRTETDALLAAGASKPAAQVVADERAAFERWFDEYHNNACDEFGGIDGTNPKGIAEDAWQGAILALAAQPEQAKVGDMVWVPLQLLTDASDSLGNFTSDHGWGEADMQAMDNIDAYIARHKAKRYAPPSTAAPTEGGAA